MRLWIVAIMLLTSATLLVAAYAQQTQKKSSKKKPSPHPPSSLGTAPIPAALSSSVTKLKSELTAKHGELDHQRITKGIERVAQLWRPKDGDAQAFEAFVRENFIADSKTFDEVFNRLEFAMEQLDGHLLEINREFRRQSDLDLGPILPVDKILAAYDPWAHVTEDFFENKLAFIVLLNFPGTTLQERLTQGKSWSRRRWSEVRLAQRFSKRIPPEVSFLISKAVSEAERYIAEYNIWMHHLLDERGNRLFPPKLRLISHWNLRDELKADYSDPNGLPKQRMIQQVMERIVTQTIPAIVINNPHVDWNPASNRVQPAQAKDADGPAPDLKITNDPEPNTRYAMLLNIFKAVRTADPYSPMAPTLIARRFDEDREIPEERVKKMFETVLTSPLVSQVASVIESRLGRSLEPFDIWYNGFRPRGQYTEAQLDDIVRKRYPTAEAYRAGIPNLLQQLGFSKERSEYLAAHIVVDPARGAGHAMGAARREDKAHLRTRIEKGGMDYKGFNVAVHEMGHNVEQIFSLNNIDHTLLQGVPNTAFTEALAFVFQGHDLELLGLTKPDATSQAMKTLNSFWGAYEIAGVALVDIAVWHWMYDHPDATAAELRDATLRIAKETWNRYYAPIFKKSDVVLLGVYSHMIDAVLYLPDYPIGHLIAFQVEEQMNKVGRIGPEFERIAKIGRVAPDIWMEQATGAPVGPDSLLRATEKALNQIGAPSKGKASAGVRRERIKK